MVQLRVQTLVLALVLSQRLIFLTDALVKKGIPKGAIPGTRILGIATDTSLYDGDDVAELLALCPNGCSADCPLVEPLPGPGSPTCNEADLRTLKQLQWTQAVVKEYQAKAKAYFSAENVIFYICLSLTLTMGFYLVHRKHFHWRNLLNSSLPDPTYGMPLWQFQRMHFTPTEIEDTRDIGVRRKEVLLTLDKQRMERKALDELLRRQQAHNLASATRGSDHKHGHHHKKGSGGVHSAKDNKAEVSAGAINYVSTFKSQEDNEQLLDSEGGNKRLIKFKSEEQMGHRDGSRPGSNDDAKKRGGMKRVNIDTKST